MLRLFAGELNSLSLLVLQMRDHNSYTEKLILQ